MTRKDGLVQVMRGARSDVRDSHAAAANFEKQAVSSVSMTRDPAVTSMDIALNILERTQRAAAGKARPVLRFALCNQGVLRIPRRKRNLRVLSGIAWISAAGKDIVASAGDCVELARTRYPVLVSAVGGQLLLFELW